MQLIVQMSNSPAPRVGTQLSCQDHVVERRKDIGSLRLSVKALVEHRLLGVEARLDSRVIGTAGVAQLVANPVDDDVAGCGIYQ